MGYAQRNKAIKQQTQIDPAIIPRVASAIRRLATAASSHFGADCYIHATIGQAILHRLGVESVLVAGTAAWRVGNGDGDVIMHAPSAGMIPQPGGLAYHVLLEIGTRILDLTTYTISNKCRQLDALDGGYTNIEWCPEYLFIEKSSISSMRDVTMLGAGLYYYRRDITIEKRVVGEAPDLDPDDVDAAWLLCQNQDLQVFGPNDVKGRTNNE